MDTTQEVAERINEAIAAAERSNAWVARKAVIALTTLNRKLDGGTDFTVSEVRRIAHALAVAPASLLPDEFLIAPQKKTAA